MDESQPREKEHMWPWQVLTIVFFNVLVKGSLVFLLYNKYLIAKDNLLSVVRKNENIEHSESEWNILLASLMVDELYKLLKQIWKPTRALIKNNELCFVYLPNSYTHVLFLPTSLKNSIMGRSVELTTTTTKNCQHSIFKVILHSSYFNLFSHKTK